MGWVKESSKGRRNGAGGDSKEGDRDDDEEPAVVKSAKRDDAVIASGLGDVAGLLFGRQGQQPHHCRWQ